MVKKKVASSSKKLKQSPQERARRFMWEEADLVVVRPPDSALSAPATPPDDVLRPVVRAVASPVMDLNERLRIVQSWWLASEIIRRHPDLLIVETHPGGGQYDCLSIVRVNRDQRGTTLANLNRAGSIHVGDHTGFMTWEQERDFGDRHGAVKADRADSWTPGWVQDAHQHAQGPDLPPPCRRSQFADERPGPLGRTQSDARYQL